MPFSIRPFRRFPVKCAVTNNAGPFQEVPSILRSIFLLVLATLSGCMGNSLGEVRATEPLQTGTFQTPYEILAACAKERIETDSWRFGQPIVQSTRERNRPLISVYAIYSRSTLFEVTFQPVPSGLTTVVEYRRGYDGHGTQDQTWGIIESCAQQGPAPVDELTGATGANH
jgi:hypothetical protein